MSELEKYADAELASGEVKMVAAPDLKQQIWQTHNKGRGRSKWVIAASVSLLVSGLYFYQSVNGDLLKQHQILEAELVRVMQQSRGISCSPIQCHYLTSLEALDYQMQSDPLLPQDEYLQQRIELVKALVAQYHIHGSQHI